MNSNENLRKLIELAVASGRKMQSPQTGFIHYHPHADDKESHLTIPLIENMLFAMALFRTRTAENVTEAKTLVDRLLYFQNLQEQTAGSEFSYGNFPIFQHEYPQCKDRYLGFQLLPPIYWILSHFGQVLGSDLKSKLEKSARLLLEYCLKIHKEKPAPPHIAIKLGSSAKAFGILWQKNELSDAGESLLSLLKMQTHSLWGCPAALGELLAALQMVYSKMSESPWQDLWNYLARVWHVPSCSFAGPAQKEYQEGFEPQPTLLDLYMGLFSNAFSSRAIASAQPFHLQGALIQSTEDHLLLEEYPIHEQGTLSDQQWQVRQTSQFAYALIERKEGWNQAQDKSFHPFRVIWGTPQRAHTFVCQGGNHRSSQFSVKEGEIDLSMLLGDVIQVEDREKNREVSFFLDLAEETSIAVNGISATTFQVGDEIKITSGTVSMTIKFHVEEGEGQFMGHLMIGNRPAQVSIKGEKRYNAYDWQIFLRTVRRTEKCRIGAKIVIK